MHNPTVPRESTYQLIKAQRSTLGLRSPRLERVVAAGTSRMNDGKNKHSVKREIKDYLVPGPSKKDVWGVSRKRP